MSINYYDDLQLMHAAIGLHPDRPIILDSRDYYCLQYNRNGTIKVQIDAGVAKEVIGPSLLVTSPNRRYVFGSNEGWDHNFIAFRGARVERYIRSGLLPLEPPLRRLPSHGKFPEKFERCVQSLRAGDLLQASHLFEGLLIGLHQRLKPLGPLPHHERIHQLSEAMRREPEADYNQGQCSAIMHVSEAHFRRLFRSLIGLAPQRFLLQCRLNASSELLATTRMPIKQIASHYKFESVHHFSRVFKNHCGVPPGRFRREALGS
jgi:AraC-like DNA-binding protein